MYLSLLKLNPRAKKTQKETAHFYELHRTILSAFPERNEGGPGKVLFRVDLDDTTGATNLLVQSEKLPVWERINGFDHFIISHDYKKYEPQFQINQLLHFRLRANPTKRSLQTKKREGVLHEEDQLKWLRNKGHQGGFEIISALAINEGFAKSKLTDQNEAKHDTSMLSVRFDGVLKVIKPDIFLETLKSGIGSAKGFGFGLLSIAPLKS